MPQKQRSQPTQAATRQLIRTRATIPSHEARGSNGSATAHEARLLISVNGEQAIGVDQQHGGCIDHLPIAKRHAVRISRDGRSFESARFSFSDDKPGTTALELRYDPFYSHVHIEPLRRQPPPAEAVSCAICPDLPNVTHEWPRDVLIRGTRQALDKVQNVPGVEVEDHGQRKVSDDEWELFAHVSNADALAALRKITERPPDKGK